MKIFENPLQERVRGKKIYKYSHQGTFPPEVLGGNVTYKSIYLALLMKDFTFPF